ncbi:MAG: glutathione peroxidase [Bdellovibrionia bacterium]
MTSIYDIEVKNIQGKTTSIGDFKGRPLLIVNVASECGYTVQYEGLEKLFEKYKDRGLVVLGFPCNQFGGQEAGTNEEIKNFCETKFHVTFPLFSKIDVNGPNAHPLFVHLKSNAKGLLGTEGIKWNFTKFLVDRQGNVLDRFAPQTKPEDLSSEIDKVL